MIGKNLAFMVIGFLMGFMTPLWLNISSWKSSPDIYIGTLLIFAELGFLFSSVGVLMILSKGLQRYAPSNRITIALKSWAEKDEE